VSKRKINSHIYLNTNSSPTRHRQISGWKRCRTTAVYCSRKDHGIFWWASRKPKKKLGQDSLCLSRKRNRATPECKYRVLPLH